MWETCQTIQHTDGHTCGGTPPVAKSLEEEILNRARRCKLDLTPDQVAKLAEEKKLKLVIYEKNPKCLLTWMRALPHLERLTVLEYANPKVLEVFRRIQSWWEGHQASPTYIELAGLIESSINSSYLYVKLLRDIGLLRRIKGAGGHKDIVPYDRRSIRDPAYLLHMWEKAFPEHPLAAPSRAIYERSRKKKE